jgi:hypothetical protein
MNWYKLAQQKYLWKNDPELPYANIPKDELDNIGNEKFDNQLIIKELKSIDKNESFQNFLNFYGTKVYHGTNCDFNKFSLKYFGSTDKGFAGRGLYFTTNKNYAKEYGNIIKEAYVRLENPFVINASAAINPNYINRKLNLSENSSSEKVTDNLIKKGYDGVIVNYDNLNDFDGPNQGFEIVVFDPSKVKTKEQLMEIWDKK